MAGTAKATVPLIKIMSRFKGFREKICSLMFLAFLLLLAAGIGIKYF